MTPIYLPPHRLDPNELAAWTFRGSLRRTPFVLAVYSFAATYTMISILKFPLEILYGLTPVVFIACLVGFWFRVKKMYTLPERNQIIRDRTVILDEKGFQVDYQNGLSSRVPWNVVIRHKWTDKFLILYTPSGSPFVLSRAVLTPPALQLIEEVLNRPPVTALPNSVV